MRFGDDLHRCLQVKLSRFSNIWGEVSHMWVLILFFSICEFKTTTLKKVSILLSSPVTMSHNFLEPLGHFSNSNWRRITFKYVLFNFCYWQNETVSVACSRRIGSKTICSFIINQKPNLFPLGFASLTRVNCNQCSWNFIYLRFQTFAVIMDTMFPWEQNIPVRLYK